MNDRQLIEQAKAGDAAAQFAMNLQRDHASETSRTDDGRKEIQLRPVEQRILPKVYRRMDLVKTELVEVFRELVTGQRPWPLYLHGPAGGGKTRAVLALLDFVDTGSYHTVDDLCDFTMANTSAEVQGEWLRIAGKHLAVLDELGTRQQVNELHYSVVKRFTDVRELHAENVAVYVSNLDPKALADVYDDRIASRVLGGTVWRLDDEDRRRRK